MKFKMVDSYSKTWSW